MWDETHSATNYETSQATPYKTAMTIIYEHMRQVASNKTRRTSYAILYKTDTTKLYNGRYWCCVSHHGMTICWHSKRERRHPINAPCNDFIFQEVLHWCLKSVHGIVPDYICWQPVVYPDQTKCAASLYFQKVLTADVYQLAVVSPSSRSCARPFCSR